MLKKVDVIVVGFGNVGRSFVKTIALKNNYLERKYGLRVNIYAVLDSRGAVFKEDGFTPYELLKLCEIPRSRVSMYKPYGLPEAGVRDIYSLVTPDIHIELTPSNYSSGEPGLNHILYAIDHGVSVVSSNKAPFVIDYKRIMERAYRKGVKVRFKATVMAGTPLLNILSNLKGYEIESVEGILNTTTNYILTEMHENLITYNEALKKAQALGIAETSPDLDVKGVDAAAKLVIISNVVGEPIRLTDVSRDDLSTIDFRDVYKAIKEGFVIKFLAKLDLLSKEAYVKIERIPRSHVLASVNGLYNGVLINTSVNKITVIGKGAGGLETAHSILDDLIDIVEVVRV